MEESTTLAKQSATSLAVVQEWNQHNGFASTSKAMISPRGARSHSIVVKTGQQTEGVTRIIIR